MTQNERLDYLVGSFKDESPEYKRVRIPEDTEGKQRLLRSLMNVRMPKPASSEAWTDFPLFRLGEIYLNLAEAVLRGGQGATKTEALGYLNDLRKRAYTDKLAAPISDSDFNLNFMLDERGREMFYEAQRRTDLVRFGKYTSGDYVWPWKGGVAEGKAVDNFYAVYPIPSDDIGSNENLRQNEGY